MQTNERKIKAVETTSAATATEKKTHTPKNVDSNAFSRSRIC